MAAKFALVVAYLAVAVRYLPEHPAFRGEIGPGVF